MNHPLAVAVRRAELAAKFRSTGLNFIYLCIGVVCLMALIREARGRPFAVQQQADGTWLVFRVDLSGAVRSETLTATHDRN